MKLSIRFLLAITFCLSSATTLAQNKISWSNGSYTIDVAGTKIIVSQSNKRLLVISSIDFNFTQPASIIARKQSTDTLTLQFNYPPTAQYREETGAIVANIDITVKGNAIRFASHPKWASNISIKMEDNDEHFFGILEQLYPENRKNPDLRGEVVDVDVLGDASQYHENYASAWSAFYMTNKGYASFFDSFASGKYKLGINGETELYHHTGKLDWYIITGKNGDEIMKKYYEIIGKPKFFPMWACGPIAWRDENKGGKNEILGDIKKMTDLKIPFTAWWVDRPYSHGAEGWSKMDFNELFSNPKEWITEIRETYGMKFMSWVGPLTMDDKDFPGLLPSHQGYLDLSDSAAVKEFGRRLKAFQYSAGVQGHKMDRADQLFPQMYPWCDKTPESERRNKYIYLYSKVIDSYLRDSFKDDQLNFARAAFQRCQPYLSAVWGGDSRSSWDGMALLQ